MSVDKLKETARRHEAKRDWKAAINAYLQAIREFESGRDPHPDLSLFNRVGDLYKDQLGDTASAVSHYERAAELYAEQGLLTNAIALCGKILRAQPDRYETYLRAAELHTRKNVLVEAKRNLIEYLDRMAGAGRKDEAIAAAQAFADRFTGVTEIRLMVVDILRAAGFDAAADRRLREVAADIAAAGDAAAAEQVVHDHQTLEHAVRASKGGPGPGGGDSGLVFLSFDETQEFVAEAPPRVPPPPAMPPPALPPVAGEAGPVVLMAGAESLLSEAPEVVEPAAVSDLEVEPLAGLELTHVADDEATVGGIQSLDGLLSEATFLPSAGSSGDDLEDFGVVRASEDSVVLGLEGTTIDGFEPTVLDDMPLLAPGEEAEPASLSEEVIRPTMEYAVVAPPPAPPELVAPRDGGAFAAEPLDVATIEERILDDPDDLSLHEALAQALEREGYAARAADEYRIVAQGLADAGDLGTACRAAARVVELAPDDLGGHRLHIELLVRAGAEPAALAGGYLALATTLDAAGLAEQARAVYERVLEHDPSNPQARAATGLDAMTVETDVVERDIEAPLGDGFGAEVPADERPGREPELTPIEWMSLDEPAGIPSEEPELAGTADEDAATPVDLPLLVEPDPWEAPRATVAEAEPAAEAVPEPAAPFADGFIDLGELVLEPVEQARDTRMKVEGLDDEAPPAKDESEVFREMLDAFKKGVEANLEADDYQAYYDLGVAYKEMGLLEEAVASFQKALRAPEGRLRTSEALGVSFYDMGKFGIAEAVLRRAVEQLPGGDEEKIGLLYWLGRALEAQHRAGDARHFFERALAVDIRFMDTGDRIQKLTTR